MAAEEFTIDHKFLGDGRCVIELCGELDYATSAHLTEALDEAVSSGASDVVIDLRQCNFIDSSGLAALLGTIGPRIRRPERVRLCAPSSTVKKTLDVSGASSVLEVIDSSEAAWAGAAGD